MARAATAGAALTNATAELPPTNDIDSDAIRESLITSSNVVWALMKTNPSIGMQKMLVEGFSTRLATARYLEKTRQPEKAEPLLLSLLGEGVPDSIKQSALLELAAAVALENDLPRAEAIYSQFLERWPTDSRIPEVLLHEGQLFREMGLDDFALTKFYAVMTAALSSKTNQFDYYQRLVLEAQLEIAETHYLSGRFADAADFYSRLLKQNDPELDRPQSQFRLIRSLAAIKENNETISQARDFLARYPDASEEAEVRFYLAQSLKQMGQSSESLQQVLLLLQEQKVKTKDHPEIWNYWQQRAGNEIANQLYREGDYVKALDIYTTLARLDPSPSWQLPVEYQIGLTYERLLQPQKAVETYHAILQRVSELETNEVSFSPGSASAATDAKKLSPGLQSVCDMARWRADFLKWQDTAEQQNRSLASSLLANTNSNSNIQ